MFKKRYFSAHHDFKTGIFCKLSFFLWILFLVIFVVLKISSFVLNKESTGFSDTLYYYSVFSADSYLAFSIIFLAVGIILYFFYSQFAKLSKIADEIENSKEFEEIE